jgi:hypothetical protein
MCTSPQSDHRCFRILLYRNDADEVLIETTDRGLQFAAVAIPRYSRVAKEITAAIHKQWNLVAYSLYSLPIDARGQGTPSYLVAEVCRSDSKSPGAMQWFPVTSLTAEQFADLSDFTALHNSLTAMDGYRHGELPGFFGKSGWMRIVTDWVTENASVFGFRLTGRFRQWNASPTFSLIRFETDSSALWFKAVGEPNLREYSITLALSRSFPTFTARLIAAHPDWNAWLTVEADGTHPDANSSFEVWMKIVESLAELQIASYGQALHLVNAGCRDVRARALAGRVEPYLELMQDLMKLQTKDSPAPLSRGELLTLGAQLKDFLAHCDQLSFSITLGHLDFNPGNILVTRDRSVFLDWVDAYVGHPFLTLEYLFEHLRRLHLANPAWESDLRTLYARKWQAFMPAQEFVEHTKASSLLAVVAFSLSMDIWQNADRIVQPGIAKHFRSLTRRMKHEADLWVHRSSREALPCID